MSGKTKQSLTWLKATFDQMPSGVLIVADDGTFIDINKAAEGVFGYSRDELIGHNMAEAIVPTHMRANHDAGMHRLQTTGETRIIGRGIEVPALRKSGEEFLLGLRIEHVKEGDDQFFIGFVSDLSDREKENRPPEAESDAAQGSDVSKSRFLANVSHELRTPLNAMLGMTNLLLDTGLSNQQREYLKTLRGSGNSLLLMINDILDFSRLEVDELTLEESSFSLRRMVEETVDLYWPQAKKAGLLLAGSTSTHGCDHVFGDVGRIRQVLSNFISNALKFTEEGGVAVHVSADEDEDGIAQVLISVRDTGPGVDPSQHAAIFDRFSQLDTQNDRDYEGVGLGLAICRQLATLMNGEIHVDSVLGEGAEFAFRLTLRRDASIARSAQPLENFHCHVCVRDPILSTSIEEQLMDAGGDVVLSADVKSLWRKLDKAKKSGNDQNLVAIIDQRNVLPQPWPKDVSLVQIGTEEEPKVEGDAILFHPIRANTMIGRIREAAGLTFGDNGTHTAAAEENAIQEARRILLVDDNQTNQTVARLLLEKMGHRVDLCSDGYEGVRAATTLPYDIVFMDVHMPGMDGIEATRRIRAAAGDERHVPIYALTANVLPETKQACLEAGMNGFLQKPVNEGRLGEVLIALGEGSVGISSLSDEEGAPDHESPNFDALPIIEPGKLDELDASLGKDKLAMVLGIFKGELDTLAERFETADGLLEQGRIAHTIKGASSNFGAARLQHAARLYEEAAQSSDLQKADGLRPELLDAIKQTLARLEEDASA